MRLPTLKLFTGLGRSSIWARLNPQAPQYDPSFPKPIRLSASGRGAVAWIRSEVVAWVKHRADLSRDNN
ncbi:helix-turn-helix transcriptional regulator [Thiocystis violascens]|uniref:helix-turn-helix transcriptional regulator n=1 Tax=Thiocystis violascens TaxID=73141 RepID=UPI000A06038A|nr:AlpA family phage regulatory protein [Thiocystis violascens]